MSMFRVELFDDHANPPRFRPVAGRPVPEEWLEVSPAFLEDRSVEPLTAVDAVSVAAAMSMQGARVSVVSCQTAARWLDTGAVPELSEGAWVDRFAMFMGRVMGNDVPPVFMDPIGRNLHARWRDTWPELVAWQEYQRWSTTQLSTECEGLPNNETFELPLMYRVMQLDGQGAEARWRPVVSYRDGEGLNGCAMLDDFDNRVEDPVAALTEMAEIQAMLGPTARLGIREEATGQMVYDNQVPIDAVDHHPFMDQHRSEWLKCFVLYLRNFNRRANRFSQAQLMALASVRYTRHAMRWPHEIAADPNRG